jgi:hypothetical protein
MLVEFLRPLGPELARRWVAALFMVHRDERPAIVESVERKIAELYPMDSHDRLASGDRLEPADRDPTRARPGPDPGADPDPTAGANPIASPIPTAGATGADSEPRDAAMLESKPGTGTRRRSA